MSDTTKGVRAKKLERDIEALRKKIDRFVGVAWELRGIDNLTAQVLSSHIKVFESQIALAQATIREMEQTNVGC